MLRRLYGWSFKPTERNVSDWMVLRQFLPVEPAPMTTYHAHPFWVDLLGPQTLERLNEGLVERVVDQSKRRVLKGESLVASEKPVSFEEHPAITAHGKAGKEKTE